MITKGAATPTPMLVIASGTYSTSAKEIVSLHFTAGAAATCTVSDGLGNKGVALGVDAANGSDDWCPAQPAKFDRIIVTISAGTLTIQTN